MRRVKPSAAPVKPTTKPVSKTIAAKPELKKPVAPKPSVPTPRTTTRPNTAAVAKTSTSKATAAKKTTTPAVSDSPVVSTATISQYDYDVCLSFAGEDRSYVQRVARCLKSRGIKYFYDSEQKAQLFGRDLIAYLDDIYQHKSRFCVMFISQHYKEKLWTNHERQSAQARAFREKDNYLLPVRIDDTEIPGIRPTLGYLDIRHNTPPQIADTITEKVHGKASPITKAAPKKSAAPRATPTVSTRGKVSNSGKWVLLGQHFYLADSVEEENETEARVFITAQTSQEEAHLRQLNPSQQWQRSRIAYAHGNEASFCQVHDVKTVSKDGKTTFTIPLKKERFSVDIIEMNFQGMTANEAAEKRARLILLDEKPEVPDTYLRQHITNLQKDKDSLTTSTMAQLWKEAAQDGLAARQKARLAAIFQLIANQVVEHIYDLTLTPAAGKGITIGFEGRRQRQYSNAEPHSIKFSGLRSVV